MRGSKEEVYSRSMSTANDPERGSVYALAEQLRLNAMDILAERGEANAAQVLADLMDVLTGRRKWERGGDVANEDEREQVERMRQSLLEKVVFLVLNFTPLRRPEQRVFVAALNWDHVEPAVKPFATEWTFGDTAGMLNDEVCPISVIAPPGELTVAQEMGIMALWQEKWNEYFRITREGVFEHRYTWNQFLLKVATFPRGLGIFLDGTSRSESLTETEPLRVPWHFAAVDQSELAATGLPHDCLSAAGRVGLLKSGPSCFRPPSSVTTGFNTVRELWEKCVPSEEFRPQILGAIPWAVHHLVRCYSFWGGSSFLSIPVTFGAVAANRTAVLSLGTTVPLDERETTRWQMLATTIFSPLLAEEAIRLAKTAERVTVLEAIGHTLKGTAKMTGWREMREKLARLTSKLRELGPLPGEGALLRDVLRPEDRIDSVADLLEMATETVGTFALSEGLGGLIRLVSVIAREDYAKVHHWADATELERWAEPRQRHLILERYARSVFVLARLACHAAGWPSLRVQCVGGREFVWHHKSDALNPLAAGVGDLDFPPFAKGSDGVIAVYPIIIEPVLNAAKALVEEGPENEPPLVVTLEDFLPDHIAMTVCNPTNRRVPPASLPPGVRDTDVLSQHVLIASFDPLPQLTQSELGRAFTIRLRLHPQQLVERILEHKRNARHATPSLGSAAN